MTRVAYLSLNLIFFLYFFFIFFFFYFFIFFFVFSIENKKKQNYSVFPLRRGKKILKEKLQRI